MRLTACMKRLTLVLSFVAAAAVAQTNPLFNPSPLPFQAPPFDKIKDADYQPAIEEGMKRGLAEIEVIANNPDPPTFDNTIIAMEKSGDLLTRAAKIFFNLAQSNTNDTMQKVEAEEAPKLSAYSDTIYLNPKLFARVKTIYDQRDALNLDAESKWLVERYFRNFIRAGAQLSDADKTALKALNQEESTLSTQYRQHVLADTKDSAIVVGKKADLAGLSESDIAAAAQAAKDKKMTGKYVITLQNTTQQPALTFLKNRALREKIFKASSARGNHGGPNDNKALIERLAQLRAQKAKLLGFSTYAAYVLDDQMAKTPEIAIKLMSDMVPATTAKAREQAAAMEKLAGFELKPWDWQYYAEQLRKKQYAMDEAQAKQYFELNRVLQDGVFYAANKLYGLTFKERHDLPVYNPDVRVFDVIDADGQPRAIWYADYYSRSNKSGGAWMDTFVDQSLLLGLKPVVFNVANFTKPAAGQPALISFTDVTTMFHEFGHALHGMFSNVKYPLLTGTSVPRDFVEFPSQFNEHWALEPEVFAHYAKNYKSGAPMPAPLVKKIKDSQKFNQGYNLGEYLEAALLDMAWHTLPPSTGLQDVNAFEPEALKQFNIAMALIPPRYHTTYFSHVWGGGYAAGYYAYLWSELIDDDAFYWFKEHGGMSRENGQRFREMVLSRGGSMEPAAMYRAFRGRDPIVDPLLIERGLKPADTTAPPH
ncbi:MAG: dipeptidyl carboxypeptidase II [Acidobacteria bacterium]|nr:MAG: dipeptidyl carboxypeptidase II [Acidobacteriota bacterium]